MAVSIKGHGLLVLKEARLACLMAGMVAMGMEGGGDCRGVFNCAHGVMDGWVVERRGESR